MQSSFKKYLMVSCLLGLSSEAAFASNGIGIQNQNAVANSGVGDFFTGVANAAADGVIIGLLARVFDPEFMQKYKNDHHVIALIYSGAFIGGVYAASKIQKMNPEFFSGLWRTTRSPFVLLQKKIERFVCGGESLEWNIVVSWHNRVFKALVPLTKQSSVMELAKEKRIQVLEFQDPASKALDVPWQQTQQHVQDELSFMSSILKRYAHYYQDQKDDHDTPCVCCLCAVGGAVHAAGKACVRLSSKRYEETAFYLKKIIKYSDDCSDYIGTVKTKEALDKELIKQYMEALCSAFEHVATLVDDTTAAAPHGAHGQLTFLRIQGGGANAAYTGGYAGYGAGSDMGSHY